jgi:hypothetical protein
MTNFNTLPIEVQADIKSALRAYDSAYVIYENGKYNVSVAIGLKAHYPADHKVIGEYKATEIFTEEERIVNYMESFHEYPRNYKGKRDYKMLHDIEGNWDVKFKLNEDGDLVIIKTQEAREA